jgi:serine/threonine protein phosphatase PrpC
MDQRMKIWFTQHAGQPEYSQQDCLLVADRIYQSRNLPTRCAQVNSSHILVAVADGVSSSPSAHLASQMILKLLFSGVRDHPDWLDGGLLCGRSVQKIAEIFRGRLARGRSWGAATTLAALHARDGHAAVVNCGDSRVYRIRPENTGQPEWRQLTKDHTIFNEMLAKGLIRGDPSDYASIYNGLAHCIIADPEEGDVRVNTTRIAVAPGDLFLLTSDGVHDVISDERLRALYNPDIDLAAQVAIWRDAVFAAGAHDNFTLAVLRFPSMDEAVQDSGKQALCEELRNAGSGQNQAQ